jgi:murein DD-endopeptidase MepM/ murein hydrolase activator NlpD
MTKSRFASFLLLSAALILTACTASSPPHANMPSREGIVPGEQITVQGNQNVYSVAKKYNVPMRDLIVLNDLKPPFVLHYGQNLTLPAGRSDMVGGTSNTPMGEPMPLSGAAAPTVEQTTLAPIELPPPVKAPVTRYANAPKSGAAPSAEVLTTPSPQQTVTTTATPAPLPPVTIIQQASNPPAAAVQPTAVPPTPAPSTSPAPSAPSASFIWPVQGPVLSAYGPKGQGLNNDGINIGAPKGAPVVAAANGIVVYAGNEMKGFGNLVLIRHQGGWVTAYAHLDRRLVAKDAVVAQGDMIGTVGASGNVGKAQLHFETRYEGKPVDPSGVIKSNSDRG